MQLIFSQCKKCWRACFMLRVPGFDPDHVANFKREMLIDFNFLYLLQMSSTFTKQNQIQHCFLPISKHIYTLTYACESFASYIQARQHLLQRRRFLIPFIENRARAMTNTFTFIPSCHCSVPSYSYFCPVSVFLCLTVYSVLCLTVLFLFTRF